MRTMSVHRIGAGIVFTRGVSRPLVNIGERSCTMTDAPTIHSNIFVLRPTAALDRLAIAAEISALRLWGQH